MKRFHSISCFITVISLFVGAIWLSPVFAAAPVFVSLGQIKADSLRVPGAMDLDGAGNLYVADTRGGLVHKFSPYGQLLEDFALQASGSGLAVTPDGQRLYVARKQSVAIVDALSGQQLGVLSSFGVNVPEFHVAGTIDLDAAGNVYVIDAGSMQVKVYDASGQYQTQFGGFGLDAGTFKQIGGMAINPAGQIVVADSSSVNAKVHAFSLDASLNVVGVTAFANTTFGTPVMNSPRGLAFDANGRGFFLEYMNSQVRVTDANFTYLGAYANAGYGDGQLNNVIDTVYDDVNNRLFVGCDTGRIEIIGLDGTGTNPVNHAPSTPVPQSPVGGSEVASPTPTLVFNNATDEDGDSLTYHVIVSRSGESVFATDVTAQASSTTSVLVGVALEENAAHSWTVQASDGTDVSEVSAAATFVVNAVPDNHAPSIPVPQNPVGGSEVTSATPTLAFANATDEDGDSLTYHVIVSRSGESVFEVDVEAQASSTTSVLVDVALEENAAHSWTVQASDGTEVSEVSAAATFVVNAVEEAPSVPVLVTPVNGESVDGSETFSWEPSVDVDPNDENVSYQFEVALDEVFEEIVAVEFLTETTQLLKSLSSYGELEINTEHFWRVTALDDDQMASSPSDTGAFVYDTTALTITANMPNALVSFHGNHAYAGQVIGEAPFQLRDMAPAVFSIIVEHAGFEPFVTQVSLAAGDNVELYAELAPTMDVKTLDLLNKGINGSSGLSVNGAAAPFLVDFDNDGDLDMLVGDGSGQLQLFANLQVPSKDQLYFGQGVSLNLPSMPGAVPFVADWNNDGRKDLIVGQANGFVILFLNTGLEEAPEFAAGTDLYAGSSALYVGNNATPAVIDYNGDGAKDLMVGNAAGQIAVYLNQGSDAVPVLAATAQILAVRGNAPMPVDWDADGENDLVVTDGGDLIIYTKVNGEYQLSLRISVNKSTFSGAFAIDLAGVGKSMLAGDTNGEWSICTATVRSLLPLFTRRYRTRSMNSAIWSLMSHRSSWEMWQLFAV